jgi:hypothetical protein
MSAVSAALVGTLEYFAKTPWKDIRIFDFISHVTNRAVSYIFGNQFGRWISGIRFNPRHVINEIYSQVIAAPVAYVYNLVAERIFPAPAGGGSGPGSGGPAPPGGGSGGWESRGGSAGGGDSDEYKRFQRFENWSN